MKHPAPLGSMRLAAALCLLPLAGAARLPFLRGQEHQDGGVVITKLGDGSYQGPYLLPIKLGGQELWVVPDTGSFALVVSSTRCDSSKCPKRAFRNEASQTYKALEGRRSLRYVAGAVDLALAEDELEMDGTRRTLKFWELLDMEASSRRLWKSAAFEGVLGLAWGKIVPEGLDNETTVTEVFNVSAFTVCLGVRRLPPDQAAMDAPSYMYWGKPGAVSWPSMSYVNIVGKNHWAVPLSTVAAVHRNDGVFRKFSCLGREKCLALLDTGSRMMSMPTQHLHGLLAQLGGVPAADCSNYDRLPDIHLTLGDVKIKIHRSIYVKKHEFRGAGRAANGTQLMGNRAMCFFLFKATDLTMDGQPLWIFGTPFFQEYIVEFDRSRQPARVGITENPSAMGGVCPDRPSPATAAAPAANFSVREGLDGGDGFDLVEHDLPDTPDALSLFGLGPSSEI